MSFQTKSGNISWAQFETCNQDPRTTFEKMCRLLFNRYFFDNKALLHSNHNNPGIEVEPIFEVKTNKRISFQAKYFSTTDYTQILHSAKQIVKHYSGRLDVLYLYCNNDLTTTSKAYHGIESVLKAANIELIPINNQTILDQVINCPIIATLYFNHHGLTNDWFGERLKISIDSLGPRYNRQFNVVTKTEECIDLFLKNGDSIARINQKRADIVDELSANSWQYRDYNNRLIDRICYAVSALSDITSDNILQCLDWASIIKEAFLRDFEEIFKEIDKKNERITSLEDEGGKQSDKGGETQRLQREIRQLQYLASIPELLEFSEIERDLIQRKMLIVQGDAGVGKSQLFANSAKKSYLSNGTTLLLVGSTYLSNDPIMRQIPLNLGLALDIDELFNILEGIGEQQNQCSTVFIDAINESGNKEIWKTGLISLFNKVDKLNHVRLAISVRTGYERLVFDETVQQKIQCREIARIGHTGFQEESVEATKAFLNYYNIPFSPSYFLQHEMTNPLFLTLFCKTYNGENFDMFTLFERIIKSADEEAQKAIGLDGVSGILKYLIYEVAKFQLNQGKRSITKKELFELGFWNTYGLANQKIPFTVALERSGFLITSIYEETEVCFFGYNLLEDFIVAKSIMELYLNKEDLNRYLQFELLKMENGRIENYSNIDAFVIVCSLYAERYNEECLEVIDSLSNFDKHHVIQAYLKSFLWRKANTVNSGAFIDFINNHAVHPDIVWKIFIENSTKPNHPLNAELLHAVLMNKTMSHRDYLWTTHINGLAHGEERLFQLIEYFDKGNKLDGLTRANIELLLTMLSWLLTSSNRFLRDKASKAMIELLKTNFEICKVLLEKFETVNDPYVIQRLYGVVFGASMKRTAVYKEEFKELSQYIFNVIFNKETVYPDILLRDYARLILERWLYEFPDECGAIEVAKIRPPYRSDEIPTVEKEEYYKAGMRSSGFNSIARSMHLNSISGPGMYGDFGRYVFQYAAEKFDGIDMENLYHYAIQFIRDQLGYDDALLGIYDTTLRDYFDRNKTKKIERIGKKYQWITMYNILARISDKHLLKDWEDVPHSFKGAWDPYVRDFDPTLNCNFLLPPNLPQFDSQESKSDDFIAASSDESEIKNWAKVACASFASYASNLIAQDVSGTTWVLLNQYETMESKQSAVSKYMMDIDLGTQEIWSMSHGYIVKESEFELFKDNLKKENFMGRWFPEAQHAYQLFNREHAWAPGYLDMFGDSWIDYEIDTDEKVNTKYSGYMFKFLNTENDDSIYDIPFEEEQEWEYAEPVKKVLGQMMPAYSQVLWEEQYDASQEDTTTFDVPCKSILNYLQLKQKEYDGYFYSKDDVLVAFDGNLTKSSKGLLIRKDYLDKYLQENNLKLFWTCLGEKQYFFGDQHQIWGEWSGFFYLEGDNIVGIMENKKVGP